MNESLNPSFDYNKMKAIVAHIGQIFILDNMAKMKSTDSEIFNFLHVCSFHFLTLWMRNGFSNKCMLQRFI